MMAEVIKEMQDALKKMRSENSDNWTLRFCVDKDSLWWEAESDLQRFTRASLDEIVALARQTNGLDPIPRLTHPEGNQGVDVEAEAENDDFLKRHEARMEEADEAIDELRQTGHSTGS